MAFTPSTPPTPAAPPRRPRPPVRGDALTLPTNDVGVDCPHILHLPIYLPSALPVLSLSTPLSFFLGTFFPRPLPHTHNPPPAPHPLPDRGR